MMVIKQRNHSTGLISLDLSELVGVSQVAGVSSADAELSLSKLGRVLCKKSEVPPAPASEHK